MGTLTDLLQTNFLSDFLGGVVIDFQIAAIALSLGLAFGFFLALLRFRGGIGGLLAGSVIGLMRAAPTFVIVFFLLNVLPRDTVSGVMIVALSLAPYSSAYIADSTLDALRHFRTGSALASLLVLPNIARAFFVLVMSSSIGAAIGVHEGIAVILSEIERATSTGDMLMLFALSVVCFGIPLQTGFALLRLIQHRLAQTTLRGESKPLPAVARPTTAQTG